MFVSPDNNNKRKLRNPLCDGVIISWKLSWAISWVYKQHEPILQLRTKNKIVPAIKYTLFSPVGRE